ncbi:MAG: aromatic ring-hydroxylating dioxygenase subunit alpha [Rhodospirillales bacterium]
MDTRNQMLDLIRNRRSGFTLDRPFYVDEAFHQIDLEMIWYREWLFVGHDCELPKPGHFFTVQIGDYPVVIVRDKDGRVRAFHNSCRHRGSRVCAAERGVSARLVCPYHQWTYDLDGSLIFARQMAQDFDLSAYSLKPVACETAGGYVFVCLADDPADFASFRAMMEPYFAPHRLADAKVACQTTVIEKGNWKLVWENNRECYHCAANHPELCRTFPEAPAMYGVSGLEDNVEMLAHWRHCEAAGLPSRLAMDQQGQFRLSRGPLDRGAASYTMSGQAAVRRPLSDGVRGTGIGTLMMCHYPTTWNHVLGDHAVTFRVLPRGAGETEVTTKWLVHRDAVEGVDYDLADLTHVWNETNEQDRRIVEENAFGIRSPAYEPGPYSEVYEAPVEQFVDWYLRFLEPRLAASLGQTLQIVA